MVTSLPTGLGSLAMYEVAVFFHILGGFIWIGGLLYVQMFWHRIILSDSDDAARSLYDAVNWSANRVIVPAAVVVLAMGITMLWWGYRLASGSGLRREVERPTHKKER